MTPRDIVERIAALWPGSEKRPTFPNQKTTEIWIDEYARVTSSLSDDQRRRAWDAMIADKAFYRPPQPAELMKYVQKGLFSTSGTLNRKKMAEYCKIETPKLVDAWKTLHAELWQRVIANAMDWDFDNELRKRAGLVAQYNFRTGQHEKIVMPLDFEEIVAGRLRARNAMKSDSRQIGARLRGANKRGFDAQKPLE